MKTVCDDCKHEFDIKKSMIESKIVKSGLTEHFFRCPRCHESYPIMRTTKEIRKKMKRVNLLRQEVKNMQRTKATSKKILNERLDKINEKIDLINELRAEIESGINEL